MENFKILADGTALSGLVTDAENQPPRDCGHCIHYSKDTCEHPVVMWDPQVIGEQGKPKPVGDKWCCNYFKSYGRILLYAVRHATDEDINLIGGWDDAPLNAKGDKESDQTAAFLKNRGIKEIYCSDMKRTLETAAIIAKDLGIDKECISPDFRLRTWDKGFLAGAEKSEENKKILGEYKDNPSWVIQDGESRNMFEDRSEEAFDFYLDRARVVGVVLLVLHNSNVKELERYCDQESSSRPDSVLPGGVLEVSEKNDKLNCKVIFKEAKKS